MNGSLLRGRLQVRILPGSPELRKNSDICFARIAGVLNPVFLTNLHGDVRIELELASPHYCRI